MTLTRPAVSVHYYYFSCQYTNNSSVFIVFPISPWYLGKPTHQPNSSGTSQVNHLTHSRPFLPKTHKTTPRHFLRTRKTTRDRPPRARRQSRRHRARRLSHTVFPEIREPPSPTTRRDRRTGRHPAQGGRGARVVWPDRRFGEQRWGRSQGCD